MRISAKGRYALASTIEIAKHWESNEYLSTIRMSKALGISKIYLEQTLVSLKNVGVLVSTKGHGGGYRLGREPGLISVWDVLITVESSLCESAEGNVDSESIKKALEHTFKSLDHAVETSLKSISIKELLQIAKSDNDDMFFMLHM